MNIYRKNSEPPLKVQAVWTLDGRKLRRIFGDGGEDLWALGNPIIEPYESKHWGKVLPSSDSYAKMGWMSWEDLFDKFHFTCFYSENPLSDWDSLEDGQPVVACILEVGNLPSPGVFLKKGESAVFTDMDCDQIRFPSLPPMYRGAPGTPVIAPLVVKEGGK